MAREPSYFGSTISGILRHLAQKQQMTRPDRVCLLLGAHGNHTEKLQVEGRGRFENRSLSKIFHSLGYQITPLF